jgi:hypothetical protein
VIQDFREPTWDEEEQPDVAARKLLAEVARVEQLNFEYMCDGYVYQQYASGRRLPNIYGLTIARGYNYPGGTLPSMLSFDISSDNQIAIGVETLTATVGSARPWCNFVTTDGDYSQRTKATRKGDYFYGLLKDCGFYDELPNMFRDMLTWAWGVGKIVVTKKGRKQDIGVERCLPSEVLWDRAYSLIPGDKQPIYHRRFVLRKGLMRKYPDHADEIANAPGAYSGNVPGLVVEIPADFVCLAEGWAPSIDGEKAGRHMMSVGDAAICDEKMSPDEDHPFFFLKGYNVGPGWQYQGVVEQTLADQLRLNKQNAVIWENQHRGAQNRWLVEEKSNVNSNSLINRTAQITSYKGTEPKLVVYQTNPPDLYSDRDATRTRILKRLGVNDFQSQGLKPSGLNSGEAIREYGDQASARHTTLARNLEECVTDGTRKLDRVCERVKPVVKAPGKRSVRKLKWDDVALPEGSYRVELAFPISSLPRTPEGQIDKANELLQMQSIDKVTYARLTLNADVSAEINPLTSARDAIESILDGIVEDGIYESPDDGLDLKQAFSMANARYWRCVADKAPTDILGMLADWRDDVKRLDEGKQPAGATGPGPTAATGDLAAAAPQTVPGPNVIPGPQPTQFPQ